MAEPRQGRADELRTRNRRIQRGGLAFSLLLHALLAFLLRGDRLPASPFAAAGPRAGDDRAAPAGGGMQVIDLTIAAAQAPPLPRPPAPVPVPNVTIDLVFEPEPEVTPIDLSRLPGVPAGGPQGPELGAGLEGGTGQGDGGTAEAGRFRVIPPTPRGLILPPADRPDRVRGREIAVWVFVDAMGRVVPDSTRLVPPTGDSGFDRRLRSQAAEWVFQPARKDGQPVAEWFRYVIAM